ncbi:hypothetical protein G5I_09288 [Acromyrmex echinatior]|uniref:Uncharacterized protein n=1 Tax=Acromyrmex echinatior TaxID=103372 RepID=F4WTT7_ACREC|nr:hypothetical protein G5I_09288 [Acromyrmex echinatior]
MLHDPTDETHRKPRQLRNTPLQKYVRLAALSISLLYAGAMYISWRKNVVPLLNDENIIREFTLPKDEREELENYITIPFLRGIIQEVKKLNYRQQTKSKTEVESEDMQAKAE